MFDNRIQPTLLFFQSSPPRQKIGIMYGNPGTTPGGPAQKILMMVKESTCFIALSLIL